MAEQPILYHGDEIEIDCDTSIWTAKKVLHVAKYGGLREWWMLSFLLEFRVDTAAGQSFAGVFIDGDEEPSIEIPVMTTVYQLFERSLNIVSWTQGTHLVELKLKSDGDKIYNRLFEVYTIPPLPPGVTIKTS